MLAGQEKKSTKLDKYRPCAKFIAVLDTKSWQINVQAEEITGILTAARKEKAGNKCTIYIVDPLFRFSCRSAGGERQIILLHRSSEVIHKCYILKE